MGRNDQVSSNDSNLARTLNYTTRKRELLSSVPASVRLYPLSRAKSEAERLIKQTYTVRVSLPADRAQGLSRKWHLSKSLHPVGINIR